MDYIINYGAGECMLNEFEGANTQQRTRLYEYYLTIMNETQKNVSVQQQNVLKRIAFAMSETDAKEQSDKVEAARQRRMKAYVDAFTNYIARKENDDLQKIIDTVDDLVEAYEDYNFDEEQTVEINGNLFTYDPRTFDVEKHKKSLGKLGEESKGNAWRVEVDENGEVVLHS